jgi:PAS domain S-box-containing protein
MVCAIVLTHLVLPVLEHTPFILGLAAVILSSRTGGRKAGFLAVAAGLVGFVLFPPFSADSGRPGPFLGFGIVSCAFTWFVARRYEIEAELRLSESRLTEDIANRKAAEDVVRLSERRLQTIIDAEPACVKVTSPDGLLLDMNRAGLEIVGARDLADIVGRPVVDLVHPDDRAAFLEMHRAASGGSHRTGEFRIVGMGGEEHWMHSHLVPFDASPNASDQRRGVLSVTSDVTERKHLEEQLRQSQKMEAVGRLAGGVAHDFNNLLMVMSGAADLGLERLAEGHPTRAELVQITDAAQRGASLTRQLLVFSRRQVIEPRLLDVNAVIGNVRDMLQRLVGEDVRIVQVTDSAPASVLADGGQLEQILMNLAANARDAMPRGGTLTIRTARVSVGDGHERSSPSVPPGTYVSLTVSDTGVGMDASIKAHLFEPFFTTKPTGEGTGLGLAAVYGIVQQSDGHIVVSSEPGQGTTVTMLLPFVEDTSVPDLPVFKPVRLPGGTETILVVEDESMVRDLVVRILQRNGYEVIGAGSLKEALTEIQSRQAGIDLLLTDVVMPVDSGPKVAERLRKYFPDLPVLYMSGYTDAALGVYGVLNPGISLLQKPFSSAQLLTNVREMLDAHARRDDGRASLPDLRASGTPTPPVSS